MPLEEAFYLAFASEGLAAKYCNNAKGVISDPINPDKPVNVGLHKESWEYLLNDFEDTFRTFKKHVNLIRGKKITTHVELLELFKEYWMNFYTKDQSKNELPKLAKAI